MAIAHNLGLPRIGADRELKKALESYWKGESSKDALLQVGKELRQRHWKAQNDNGSQWVTVGDFAWYDHILEWSCTIGVVPHRYTQEIPQPFDLDLLFAMARGRQNEQESVPACEMTKWYDTNYHYIVPELKKDQTFKLSRTFLFDQVKEAQGQGYQVKVVLPGPVTYLALSKGEDFGAGTEFNGKLDFLPNLLAVYKEVLSKLKELNVEWVQLDEAFALLDINDTWQQAFKDVYAELKGVGPKILVATYFESPEPNQDLLKALPVDGLHIDLTRGETDLVKFVSDWDLTKVLSLGVIDGRNIWRADLDKITKEVSTIAQNFGDNLWLAPSCSLLHVPYDVEPETKLHEEVKQSLAFTIQKLQELNVLAHAVNNDLSAQDKEFLERQNKALETRRTSAHINNQAVKDRVKKAESIELHRPAFADRVAAQHDNLNLPLYPTTTIGSFPQTKEIRQLRSAWKKGNVSDADYENGMKKEIELVIREQENLGLDVLVHGEPERNDMVEYFGELLNGFAFTQNGWVQSYGSRCVKPPIIFGDVSRSAPMTVEWAKFAQSLSDKPVKGMLTGPVTMLQWSFVRDDQPRSETCRQLALVLRDEILDLEAAGIKVIQIDEPAIREGLPLRREKWDEYLKWAVDAFLLSTSGVRDETQIHTHMCYSEFNDIIKAIADMDADVITIETSRSNMELLQAFEDFKYPNEIGPGVYDIHSPNVPDLDWMVNLIRQAAKHIDKKQLWVNPDCGLKTRGWPETKASLDIMVKAAKQLRQEA
ncbi:5-methyltetrahydropteroyltriglutamate--homocysteine S-methyltransferase [Brackiella oedipodis]|uniref:5-methyltetrahydropteroyltriglutamate-- homocysteine S-methyltransferase n=1 Tax=Brackiella oedipodis TaxID=124225 RepID=UPI00048C3463|nr:5-methyltetrahydropteroyltriglutamate--homocysteine S-methyltransferase [Brackiella oedipodis]